MTSMMANTPALHNLYPDPFNPGHWIHSMDPIPQIITKQLPKIANNTQNKNLGVNGKKKITRCPECTRPKKSCNCKKYAEPSYANCPDAKALPLPGKF